MSRKIGNSQYLYNLRIEKRVQENPSTMVM